MDAIVDRFRSPADPFSSIKSDALFTVPRFHYASKKPGFNTLSLRINPTKVYSGPLAVVQWAQMSHRFEDAQSAGYPGTVDQWVQEEYERYAKAGGRK